MLKIAPILFATTLTEQSGQAIETVSEMKIGLNTIGPVANVSSRSEQAISTISMSSFSQNLTGPTIENVLEVRFGTTIAAATLAQVHRLLVVVGLAARRLFAFGRWL